MIRTSLHIAFFCLIASFAFSFEAVVDSAGESGISFKGLEARTSARIIHFKWEVDAEIKGDYFIIEKSLDKINWTSIKEVKSLGNHKERHTYQVSEINFSEGVKEYFRILRMDAEGETEELDLIEVNQPILSNMLVLPPHKDTKNLLVISYDSVIQSKGLMFVKNEAGETVYHRSIYFDEGYNRVLLNIKRFEKGHYAIIIRDEFGDKVTRSFNTYNSKRKK